MTREMTEWPSKCGPITEIVQSGGCKGDTVPFAVGRWYDFPEFGGHLGKVDSSGHPENLGSDGQAAIRPWWPTITFTPLEKCTHHGPTPLLPWLNRHCSKRKLHDVSYRAGL